MSSVVATSRSMVESGSDVMSALIGQPINIAGQVVLGTLAERFFSITSMISVDLSAEDAALAMVYGCCRERV
jgi:hypothetical protein